MRTHRQRGRYLQDRGPSIALTAALQLLFELPSQVEAPRTHLLAPRGQFAPARHAQLQQGTSSSLELGWC